jgi:hypothetical protein
MTGFLVESGFPHNEIPKYLTIYASHLKQIYVFVFKKKLKKIISNYFNVLVLKIIFLKNNNILMMYF